MVRFFVVVRQSPSYGLVVLALVTVLGAVNTWLNPADLNSALGMVLFVQIFLASTGFAVTARRGHFDPVLLHGSAWPAVLLVHWCASIAPGALAWAAVGGYGYMWSSPAAISALAGTRLVAFVIVSVVSWVAGFLLPRGAGGALWMGVLVAVLVRRVDLITPAAAQDSAIDIARTAGALVVCPFLLLGTHVRVGVPALTAALAATTLLLVITIRLGSRLDAYLVER